MPSSTPPPPEPTWGIDPAKPVALDPVEGVDLPTCAAIAARIAARVEPRPALLARAGLDEMRWITVEQTWMLRVATSLLQQDFSLSATYDEAFARAQAEIAASSPDLSIEQWAAIVARIEDGVPLATVLREAKLGPAVLAHQQRRWAAVLAADPERAATFRDMVTRSRTPPR